MIVCTKRESLRRTTHPRSCFVVLSYVSILSSVRCSVQLTRYIRRNIYTALLIRSFFSSAFFRVQPAASHVMTVHTSEGTSFIFRSLFIPLSFQIGKRSSILLLAIPIWDLVYLLQPDDSLRLALNIWTLYRSRENTETHRQTKAETIY